MMWALGVKFLRGVCVATDTGQWSEAEWPPHPARLFMALAASYFETREPDSDCESDQLKRRALEWLEQQPAPRLLASQAVTRTVVTVFVPVNDSTKTDQLLAGARSRQPRFFPTSIPDHDELFYVWDGPIDDQHLEGLSSIAFDVSRIGHSSSLVQVWVEQDMESILKQSVLSEWVPSTSSDALTDSGRLQDTAPIRIFASGSLASYEANYNGESIEQFVALQEAIAAAKGREKAKLREDQSKLFPAGMPNSQRPPNAQAVLYHRLSGPTVPVAQSHFDQSLMVLSFQDAPFLGIESTLQLAGAFRKRIHDAFPDRKGPEWLSGHKPDGTPSDRPHVAIVPLPFVEPPRSDGRRTFADGHLLGMALAFPREIPERERALALRNIFERTEEDDDWIVRLLLHNFRHLTRSKDPGVEISLVREQRLTPPRALRSSTWTQPCTVWETVTPIVLDRFPKRDRTNERQAWNEEVATIIASSCQNIGLPQPSAIHVHHNAFLEGVPKSRPAQSGFPAISSRTGKPTRFQIHARIEFDQLVAGPVIIGAGRFVGYGFCRPNPRRTESVSATS